MGGGREDTPRATFAHEAFGSEWDLPVNLPVWAALTMQGATSETGSFDPGALDSGEFMALAEAILGPDVYAAWTSREMDIDLPDFAHEVGRAYGAKLTRSRQGGARAEVTPSPEMTSSDGGTSSTPPSPSSTGPESTPT